MLVLLANTVGSNRQLITATKMFAHITNIISPATSTKLVLVLCDYAPTGTNRLEDIVTLITAL